MADLFLLVRGAGSAMLDLVLPPHCLTCDAIVETPGRFCADCFAATGFVGEPCCACCGVPFDHAAQRGPDGLCGTCLVTAPRFGRARAAFRYDARSKRIIMPLKYGDRTDLAAALAPHMARAGAVLLREADLLVPAPLHRRRLFARRYNQAALLARAVGRLSGVTVAVDALQRPRATAPLHEQGALDRALALEGAIIVRPSRREGIAGRRVVLVDDVLTTGATANACAEALFAAAAASVDVLAAARVPAAGFD